VTDVTQKRTQFSKQTTMERSAADPILDSYPYIRLNTAQTERLTEMLDALEKNGGNRPKTSDYERLRKGIKKIPATKNTIRIPGTTKVPRNAENPWPAPQVRINKDEEPQIPEGLALYSLMDSAGTHSVLNAGETAWTVIWNYWRNLGKEGRYKLIAQSQPKITE
jgi:hypothetical protein